MLSALVLVLAVATPKTDTSHWEKKTLASLGKQAFSFKASLKLPPKSKTKTSSYTVGNEKGGGMAYVDLPSGVRVGAVPKQFDRR